MICCYEHFNFKFLLCGLVHFHDEAPVNIDCVPQSKISFLNVPKMLSNFLYVVGNVALHSKVMTNKFCSLFLPKVLQAFQDRWSPIRCCVFKTFGCLLGLIVNAAILLAGSLQVVSCRIYIILPLLSITSFRGQA